MHVCNSNVYSELVTMCHQTLWCTRINTFNMRTLICKVARNKFPWIRTVNFLNTRSNEWMQDFCSFREGFYWDGSWEKANILIPIILSKKGFFPEFSLRIALSITNILWCGRFLWEMNFKMWNHRSDLIKSREILFKICPLVALTSA